MQEIVLKKDILNIYTYIFIHSIDKSIFIYSFCSLSLKEMKKILSGILVILLVVTTFSLANCELNFTPFWSICGI